MRLEGRVWILGDCIDTDVLAPGRYMGLPPEALARYCLEAIRPNFASQVKLGDIIIAGKSFGIGSSREQAAESLKILGIKAVVAKSLGGIFQRNALNLGLVCVSCPKLEIARFCEFETVKIDLEAGRLNKAGQSWECEKLPNFLRKMISDGGLITHLKKEISAKEENSWGLQKN